MKTTGVIVCLFLFIGIASLHSQAQEVRAMPENFFVIEEFVQPANLQKFNKVQQEVVELWKKFEFDMQVYSYATDASSFYWVIPIENFGGIDELYKRANILTKKMEEDGYDVNKEFRDLSTTRETVIHWEKDLSYHPDGFVGQTNDKRYCKWTFVYLKAGHQQEAANAIKKYIAYFDSIEETWEWDVYSVYMGYDSPCLIIMDRSENPLELNKLDMKLKENHSEKFSELWKNFQLHIRRMETVTGWFLPDWSLNYELK